MFDDVDQHVTLVATGRGDQSIRDSRLQRHGQEGHACARRQMRGLRSAGPGQGGVEVCGADALDALPVVGVQADQGGRESPVLLLEDVLAQQVQRGGQPRGPAPGQRASPEAASASTASIRRCSARSASTWSGYSPASAGNSPCSSTCVCGPRTVDIRRATAAGGVRIGVGDRGAGLADHRHDRVVLTGQLGDHSQRLTAAVLAHLRPRRDGGPGGDGSAHHGHRQQQRGGGDHRQRRSPAA